MLDAEYVTVPTGPIKCRKINAAPENRNFAAARANVLIDNFKLKHIPEGKIRSQDVTISNIESKNVVTKPKIWNKQLNQQALKTAVKQELKQPTQQVPVGVNKLALQKKKMIIAQKAKALAQLANIEKSLTAPKAKNIANISNVQIQNSKPQDKTPSFQKIKAEENPTFTHNTKVLQNPTFDQKIKVQESTTLTQKTKVQENPTSTQNTKVENDLSTLNNKAQENESYTSITKTQNNTFAQDNKPQVTTNTSNMKSAREVLQKNIPEPQDNRLQEKQRDDKVSAANTVDKQSMDESKTEVNSEQKCELSPLLAHAVEEELQDIMIQVWQELPDDPVEEGDRVAVEKLRNEAGDELRRVLGLNITKRLLNVYNNLFLKVQFTCRPQMGCLTSFLKEYHINNFKRIDRNSNTFAAQMETIEDFDKLYALKELMCGEAKVTVTSCYKFTQCPENLKTIYDDNYFYDEDAPQVLVQSPKNKNEMHKARAISSNGNNSTEAAKAEKMEVESTDKPDSTEIKKPANSMLTDPNEVKKDSITTVKKNTTDSLVKNSLNTKSKDKKVHDFANDKEINKYFGKDKAASEYIIKDRLESDEDEFESDVPEYEMDAEDELGDEDILALMSEGVVLDECSGSEEDK